MMRFTASLLLGLFACMPASAQTGTGRDQFKKVFKERSPESKLEEQSKRFKWSKSQLEAKKADYELAKESYQIFVPKSYKRSRKSYGLLVWIAPSHGGYTPPFWEKKMSQYKMIGIGANDSGNHRTTTSRIGMALDAVHNMKKRYRIDEKRVYIAGFSGGGRVASFIAFHYPEIFRGGIYVGGCDFYKNVPMKDGKGLWRGVIAEPSEERLGLVKERSRHVFMVGVKDPALAQCRDVSRIAESEGFKSLKFIEVPKMGHSVGDGKWFEKALKFLDKG